MNLRKDRGPSFFEILTSQADQIVIGVDLLTTLFKAPEEQREELRNRLHEVEHQADEINHSLTRKLNQTFITPFDREDIAHLAGRLDDCMDLIDEAGDLLVLYGLSTVPQPIEALIEIQIEVLARCAAATAESMPNLKKPGSLHDYWVEVNRLENEGDLAYRRTLMNLFDSDLDPVTVIKLKDVIEALEECTDAFEDLGNSIESIAVKES